jgi:hypothetical protein
MASDEGNPEDPMTALAEGAASMHELFMAYVNAGFTSAEALQIVIAMATASIRPQ